MMEKKFVLCALNVSSFSFRKQEKGDAARIAEAYNADRDYGNVWKRLFPKRVEEKVSKLSSAARNFLVKNSFSSGIEGIRLVKVMKNGANVLLPLEIEMDKFIQQFEDVKSEILSGYDTIIDEAKEHLQDWWNPRDYPSKQKIDTHMRMRFSVIPVDESLDVFQQLEEAAKEDAASQIAAKFKVLVDNLNEPGARFKATVLDTCQKLATEFAEFLEPQAYDAMMKFQFDAEACREDDVVRKETAERAKSVLDIFNVL